MKSACVDEEKLASEPREMRFASNEGEKLFVESD